MTNTNTSATQQLIVFKIGNEEYALRIDTVKEVVLTPKTTQIPLTPEYIRGVANIRGEILPIIDLALRLKLPHDCRDAKYTLVVEHENIKLGILSPEVPNTLTATTETIDTDLSLLQQGDNTQQIMEGLVKIGSSRLVILLKIESIVLKDDIISYGKLVNHS